MAGMVQDHQQDVQEFKDAAQSVKDPEIKQWVTSTLPTLEKHLSKAKQIDAKVNPGSANSNSPGGGQ